MTNAWEGQEQDRVDIMQNRMYGIATEVLNVGSQSGCRPSVATQLIFSFCNRSRIQRFRVPVKYDLLIGGSDMKNFSQI